MAVDDAISRSPVAGVTDPQVADEIAARLDRLVPTSLHRLTVGTIALGTFFDAFDSLLIAAALTAIVPALRISYTQVGLLISAAYVGMAIGAPLFGWLSEHIGRKPVCVMMVGSFGILSIAAAFTWNFQSLAIVRIIQGLALGGQIPVSSAWFSEFLPLARRGRGFFWGYTVLFTIGIFLAPLVGLACFAIFGPAVGWRALFLTGGLAVPVAILMQLMVPESPRWLADNDRGTEADLIVSRFEARIHQLGKSLVTPEVKIRSRQRKTRLAEMFEGMYLKRTVLSWTMFFVTYFVSYGLQIWVPTLYVKIGGLPPRDALTLALVTGAITLALVFFWGELADRIGRKKGFIVGYALAVLGFALGIFSIAVLHATGWRMLFSSSLLALVGTNFAAALCFLYAAELFPTRMRAWATSTGSTISRIGSFIAPTAVGTLLDAHFGIVGVYVMFGVISCVGIVVIALLGTETSKGTLEQVSQ